MRNFFLNSQSLWNNGSSLVRMITGIFMIYHGFQVFDSEAMTGYGQWLIDIRFPLPAFMAYVGKSSELLSGTCLVLGLFTRIASGLLVITMSVVTFAMGHGKIFTDDQHPFLFILLGLVFFFSGPGPWSLDYRIFKEKSAT